MPDYEPDDREQTVLDVVREEHRVNPMRVREATDLRKQYVNDALRQLEKAGYIRKVNRGLYEYIGDDAPDIDAAQLALEAAIRAAEQGDDQELQRRLREIREALNR